MANRDYEEKAAYARTQCAAQDEGMQRAQAFLDYMRVHWAEVAPCSCHQIEGHAPDCAYERTVEHLRVTFCAGRAGG
jgi:hypothetical protein